MTMTTKQMIGLMLGTSKQAAHRTFGPSDDA
jgi:hypothetical protein